MAGNGYIYHTYKRHGDIGQNTGDSKAEDGEGNTL